MKEIARLNPDYAGISHEILREKGSIQWPCNSQYPEGCSRLDGSMVDVFNFVEAGNDFQTPEVSPEFPHMLMAGKAEHFWHHNNIMQRTFIPKREYNATLLLYPEGFVEISNNDAGKLEVRDKWTVKMTSARGAMDVQVRISEDVRDGTAFVPYFIRDMIERFLMPHEKSIDEDSVIPVKIERV
jgi:formate dehydrogenase major subunit